MSTATTLVPFAPPHDGRVDVLVIAGEHSGDEHAARMVGGLLREEPEWRVCALGGGRLAAAGAQVLFDLTASSVVGLVEVVRHFRFFRDLFHEVLRWIDTHRPRVVCLVDYPGFNLRLAQALAERGLSVKGGGGVRVVFYIGPQIWAWKARRRFAMARTLDALAVIFPFEVRCYADTALPVAFVGHPFVAGSFVSTLSHRADAPVLLLPGSRRAAVERIAPVLLDGFAAFRQARSGTRAVMIFPSVSIRSILKRELARRPHLDGAVRLLPNDAAVAASAVLTSSGTMSLVCALAGVPGAIAYRANPLTYLIGRHLVKIPFLGIANLLLPEPLYPEYIQGAATPEALAAEIIACREEPARLERTRALAAELHRRLEQPREGDASLWLARQIRAAP